MSPAKKLALVKNSPARAISQADKPTSILDQRFKYRSSAETDLRSRFKALGFKTPKPKKPQFGK
jgi:hypothetical protein